MGGRGGEGEGGQREKASASSQPSALSDAHLVRVAGWTGNGYGYGLSLLELLTRHPARSRFADRCRQVKNKLDVSGPRHFLGSQWSRAYRALHTEPCMLIMLRDARVLLLAARSRGVVADVLRKDEQRQSDILVLREPVLGLPSSQDQTSAQPASQPAFVISVTYVITQSVAARSLLRDWTHKELSGKGAQACNRSSRSHA